MPALMPIPHANLPAPSAQANVTRLAVPPSAAGHMLSLSLSEVYERMRNGELDSYADGRARRITMKSIHAYMARRLAASADGWKQITPQPRHRGRQQLSRKRV
jgi:excisionase family DNA binding protein